MNKSPHARIVVPVPIVVQAGFTIKVLALKAQGVGNFGFVREAGQLAVGFVLGLPDDVAAVVGDFLWGAQVVEMVVVDDVVFDQCQGSEGVRFEQVMLAVYAFGCMAGF